MFIHHEPMESGDNQAYKRAYDDATARYGKLDLRIWASAVRGRNPLDRGMLLGQRQLRLRWRLQRGRLRRGRLKKGRPAGRRLAER